MELKKLAYSLTVCKIAAWEEIKTSSDFFFIGKTDEELSLVCRTEDTPARTTEREDGWKAFRIQGVLDFSLVGILSGISSAGHRDLCRLHIQYGLYSCKRREF